MKRSLENKTKLDTLTGLCHRTVLMLFLGAVMVGASAFAQTPEDNVLLVKLTPSALSQLDIRIIDGIVHTGIPGLDALAQQLELRAAQRVFRLAGRNEARHEQFGLNRYYKFTFDPDLDLEAALELYRGEASLELAQLSRRYELYDDRKSSHRLNFIPNDPLFPSQWHYHNTGQTGGTPDADIDAPEAWDIETGDPSVIVSDLDTGQDLDHPDLAANLWVNAGETPANGFDDDGNGYIDDVNGWDFSDGDNFPDDYADHGTHTAGTVAAVTNNGIGVAGVAFDAKVMACKIFPSATDPVISEAFAYAADNGSIVSTNSWGYSFPGPPSPVIEAAIDYFLSTTNGVVVFAAGNSNSNDPTWGYPASYPPVIGVAATNHNDLKSSFSNWGDWVDVSAPGSNVLSTVIGGYASFNGTSMACPHVAAVAALIFSENPGWTGAQVRAQLEASTDDIDPLNPGFEGLLGTGRVNAYKALSAGPFPNPPTNLNASVTESDVELAWDDPTTNTDGGPINLAHVNIFRDGTEIAEVGPGVETYTDAGVPDGAHSYHATATNVEGEESNSSNVATVLVGDIDVLIWLPNDVIDPNVAEKAEQRGLAIEQVQGLLRVPTSHIALQEALQANGKTSAVVADIAGLDLFDFEAVFAVIGIYPNNHVILANSVEALALQDYLLAGGKAYMEGGDLWFYDPVFLGGHNFGPLFGIEGLVDGSADLATVNGVAGTLTEDMNFTYSGENNYIDRLMPLPPAFTVHKNSAPLYDCGIAHESGSYATIGNSFQFGGLNDASASAATKDDLMSAYIDFFALPGGGTEAVIWMPGDVLEPDLAKKAAQRGLTIPQVQTLLIEITSHVELKAALEANGKSVDIVDDLLTTDLTQTKYLFVVLGIYPNNHVIKNTDPEVQIIENFMATGGKVYMEGGDVWFYDPEQLEGHNFGPAFGIDPQADGVNDLKTVMGSCETEGYDFVYKGVDNFIDHLAPVPGGKACLFHTNLTPFYGCGVGHDPGLGAPELDPHTIGTSFQFGGLSDHTLSEKTKTEMMAKYLEFLDSGLAGVCQITVISPNGGESLIIDETANIVWTSANTGGFVNLELSTNGGGSFSAIASNEPDDGLFAWTVPDAASPNCLVRISDVGDPGCSDVSDTPFAIVPKLEWLVPVTVTALSSLSDLPDIRSFSRAFGGHPNGTEGFDPGLDVPTAPPGFNYYAYFAIAPPISFLSTDIRGWSPPFEADIDWFLNVVNANGITSEVCWVPSELPSQGTFTLKGAGDDVNMRTQSCVQFTGNATLTIEYRSEVCVTFNFSEPNGAWYLISLPVIPEDGAVSTLFPNATIAFEWDAQAQTYVQTFVMEPEKAYWLLVLSAQDVDVCGQPLNSYTHTYEAVAWYLTGSVLQNSPLIDNPDQSVISMFGWDPGAMEYYAVDPEAADAVQPKQGYWILIIIVPSTVTVGQDAVAQSRAEVSSAELEAFYKRFGKTPPLPPNTFADRDKSLPTAYGLAQNYPNPFNPQTTIGFQLPRDEEVSLKIYDVLGRPVRTLVDGEKEAGYYRIVWDGKSDAGLTMSAGVYLCRLQSRQFTETRKIVLMK